MAQIRQEKERKWIFRNGGALVAGRHSQGSFLGFVHDDPSPSFPCGVGTPSTDLVVDPLCATDPGLLDIPSGLGHSMARMVCRTAAHLNRAGWGHSYRMTVRATTASWAE